MASLRFILLSLLFAVCHSVQDGQLSLLAFDPSTPFSWPAKAENEQVAEKILGPAPVSALEVVNEFQTNALQTVRQVANSEKHIAPSSSGNHIKQIFPMIFGMYGSLAILWVIHSRVAGDKQQVGVLGYQKVGLLCLTWCTMSVGMHTLNKTLAVLLGAPSLIALTQMAVSVIIFGAISWRDIAVANRSQMFTWMIVPVFFAAMLISSFYTYQYISLSLLTIIRNLTPLVVLPIETLTMPEDKQPLVNKEVVASILVMLCGAIIYSGNLTNFSWVGVFFAVLNMFIACTDRLIQRQLLTNHCKGLTSATCSILNNGFAMIPTIGMAMMTHEVATATTPENIAHWSDPQTIVLIVLSGFIGMGICYFGFECQREISATSFMVMQNVSKIAVVAVGVSVFGDPLSSVWAYLGLVMSISGSLAYGKAQMEMTTVKQPTESQKLLEGDSKKACSAEEKL